MRLHFPISRLFLLIGMWLCGVGACQAALFNITYDDIGDRVIGTSSMIGSGVFSFSGAATVGNFTLSSLPDLAFSASFGGDSFSTSDIISNLNLTGISIFDRGAGEYGLVFTGNTGGSLDLLGGLNALSHEPTAGLGSAIGCCGGNGETNLYFFRCDSEVIYFGDYSATTASTVPAPTSIALVVLGLLGLIQSKRHTAAIVRPQKKH